MPIRRSPNGARHVRPQPGRNRPERVVAVNRNAWSQSVGIGGRNHPVRADLGTAATAGLVSGYLWYVFVHYATHHWRLRRGSYLYRARLRHARHHHLSHSGNFGVTTSVWDHVFGTALEARAPNLADAK